MKNQSVKFLFIASVITVCTQTLMPQMIEVELQELTNFIKNNIKQPRYLTHEQFIALLVDELCDAAMQKNTARIKEIIQTYDAQVIREAVNTGDEDNATPLHCAASTGYRETIQLLIKAGAEKSIQDDEGKTALDYAVEFTHDEDIMALLTPS